MLRLEFAAVQIIAVNSVRNSGFYIAGYLIKAGHPIHNTVSTGDLNRGRRVRPRLLFGSFCRSKKNKSVPFRKLSDKQKVCPCRGSTLRGFSAACGGYPCCCCNNMFAASRHFCGASGRRPIPVHAKRVLMRHASRDQSLASQAL